MSTAVLVERTELTHAGLTAGDCRRGGAHGRRGRRAHRSDIAFARSKCSQRGRRAIDVAELQVRSGVGPFANAGDVDSGWLAARFKELSARGGDSSYNLAYATASRLKDITDDLKSAMTEPSVRSITRDQGKSLASDSNYRVYRESALVGQAYTSVRNESFRFFVDLFTFGDVGRIDANGIDASGESGYSNGFDATCSTFPFRC